MNNTDKKVVIFLTDFALTKSGFGRHCKALLEYLYKTNKYRIINAAVGMVKGAPQLDQTPWESIGVVDPVVLHNIKSQNDTKSHGDIERIASYGAYSIDSICKQYKPSVIIAAQDPWGNNFCADLKYWNKVSSLIHTTLDSRPTLPMVIDLAKKCKNFWVWSDFATKDLNKLGKEWEHVKTVPGCLDTKQFYRLSDSKRTELRIKNNIDPEAFIGIYVFRNQLRKSVPNILQGFKSFKDENPKSKMKLLFHTNFKEGWNIHEFCKDFKIDKNDILTTYICKACARYQIKPYDGDDKECPFCRNKAQITTNPQFGVKEEELNEIYNLADVGISAFTSGGLEYFHYEAMLTEIPVLVTNYSCGEDVCNDSYRALPLDYTSYYEPGTQFQKSTTYPSSIAKQLKKVYNMSKQDRLKLGKKGREETIKNLSIETIGKIHENFIDSAPIITDYSIFDEKQEPKNPNAFIPDISDDEQWICKLYTDILKVEPDKGGGIRHWQEQLKKGMTREQVKQCFVQIATGDNQKIGKPFNFEDFLIKNDKKRVILIQPESAGDCFLITSLFKSIRDRYPKETWDFYVSSKKEYKDIFDGNEYITKWIEYMPQMDQHIWLVGNSIHNGYFNVAYHPYFGTQKMLNYLSNGQDKLDLDILSKDK